MRFTDIPQSSEQAPSVKASISTAQMLAFTGGACSRDYGVGINVLSIRSLANFLSEMDVLAES